MSRTTATTAVNLVIATPRDGESAVGRALSAHPEIGTLTQADFAPVDGTKDQFPLNTFDPLYVPGHSGGALEVLGQRLAGTRPWIALTPARFIEHAHVQWTLCQGLGTGRVVFVLPDPVSVIWRRFVRHLQPRGLDLSTALARCEQAMHDMGRWENRGRWADQIRYPDELTWLIEGGVYAAAVGRAMRLRPDDVHVVLEGPAGAVDGEATNRLAAFLDLTSDLHVPGRASAAPEPDAASRAIIAPYVAIATRRLADLVERSTPW